MTTRERFDLNAGLRRWVDEGLVDAETAARIAAREAARTEPQEPMQQAEPGQAGGGATRLSYAVEALGYLGATLAVIAGFIAVAELWPDIPTGAQLGFAAAGAVILAVAGAVVPAARNAPFARLRSVLWLLSTACVAAFTALLGAQVLKLDDRDTFLVTSAATAAVAFGWWLLTRAALQHAALFVTSTLTAIGVLLATAPEVDSWWVGLTVWAYSAGWAALTLAGLVTPRRTGLAVAVVGLVAGTVRMTEVLPGSLLALGTVAALLVVGVRARQAWLLAAGAVDTLLVVPAVAERYLPESVAAPLAVFLVGVVLVGVAVRLARRH